MTSETPAPRIRGDSRSLHVVLIYAVFAALWILLSDTVVEWLFKERTLIVMVGTLKGWLFVAVTSLLLYGLLRRGSISEKLGAGGTARGIRRWLPFLMLSSVIVAVSAVGIAHIFTDQRNKEIARLQTIADLKAAQISDWLDERQSDARFLADTPFYTELVSRLLERRDPQTSEDLHAQLQRFIETQGFEAVTLLDAKGQTFWNLPDELEAPAVGLRETIATVVRERSIMRIGPYRDAGGRLHLDFVVPLATADQRAIAVAVLHADPQQWLFPALQRWPTQSASGETLLFRRDADDALFLNELRHHPGSAALLRVPQANTALLASQVLRGAAVIGGVVTGSDYRGIPALGIVRAIPDTDWYLIAKLDKEELYADAVKSASWIAMAGLLAMLTVAASLVVLRQNSQLQLAEARHASDIRYRALFENSLDGVLLTTPEGSILAANPEAQRIFGYSEAALRRASRDSLIDPDDPGLAAALEERKRTGYFRGELTLVRQDGSRLPAEISSRIFLDSDGQPVTSMVVRDITERQRAAASLELWASAFRHAGFGLAIADARSNTFIAVNPVFAAERGYRPEELVGKPIMTVYPADQIDTVVRHIRDADTSSHGIFESEHVCKDGRRFPVLMDVTSVKGADGAPQTRIAYALDITGKKRAEAELRAAQDRLRAVIDTIPDLIWLKDVDGRYLACNRRFEHLYGASEAEILGKTDYDFAPRELADFFRAHDRAAMEAGQPTENEEELVFANDGHREMLLTVKTPFRDSNGRLVGVLGIAHDITARKATEEELRQRNEALERFNHATVDRELDMIELKKQVNALAAELGRPAPYDLGFLAAPAGAGHRDAP